MPAIPWNEFSKEELVELLHELEQCQYVVQPLWSESDVHLVSDCSCAPTEEVLPRRVLELRDLAVERSARRQRRRESPLRRLLEIPFRRQHASNERAAIRNRESRGDSRRIS